MKTIIVFLLIFISFAHGNQLAWEFSADSFSNETNTTQSTPSVTNSTASTTTTVLTTTTLSPTATVGINVTWIFYSGVNVTYVEMTITNLQAKEWAAIGFGEQTTMVNRREREYRDIIEVFCSFQIDEEKIEFDEKLFDKF